MRMLDRLLAPLQGPTPLGTIIVFGATGDLVTDHGVRKALADLVAHDDLVPGQQRMVFTSRRDVSSEYFLTDVRDGDPGEAPISEEILARLSALGGFESKDAKLVSVDFNDPAPFANLPEFRPDEVVLFYAALPPSAYPQLIERLVDSKLMENDSHRRRLVLEKPFGADLAAAHQLAELVQQSFPADQVYLVDHFLEYAGMREWLSLRSKPSIEKALSKSHLCPERGVHVLLNETILSNDRAYFRETGILEDMLQNHAMQILANSCMDLAGAETAQAWRDQRRKVIEALRWNPGQAIRAQVEGFNDVAKGAPEKAKPSTAETFASVAFTLDLDRWRDIPMRMTAGKGVDENRFGIDLHLRSLPQSLAQELGIEADQEAVLKITVNKPNYQLQASGKTHTLKPDQPQPLRPAYSRVFLDALRGEQAFFVDPRGSVAAWKFINEIQEFWNGQEAELPTYPAGTGVADLIAAKP